MPRVVQVVPRLPPPPEGVGGYAVALAEALRSKHGMDSLFLVASPSWTPGAEVRPSAAERIPALDARALDRQLAKMGAGKVVVHYVNYGYHPRGCPDWLVEGLRSWKAGGPGRRLVTVFHEVYATGLPWRSSFWLSPVQRRLAARLARLSDGLMTSMRLYRRALARWAPGREIPVLPVFSAVGEPPEVPPLAGRLRRLVLFGGPGMRRRAYLRLGRRLDILCRRLGIEETWDVGPDLGLPAPRVAGRPVRQLGVVPAAEVSALLLESLAGFLAYPGPFLPKSTVFAAYCAHGVLPACGWPVPRRQVERLPPFWRPEATPPFWRPGATVPSPEELQGVADRARAWYAGHTLDHHADTCRDLLLAGGGRS